MTTKNTSQVDSAAAAEDARAAQLAAFLKASRGGDSPVFSVHSAPLAVTPISTGAPALDSALGIGGIPKGRVIELYGPESSGKTSLALSIAGQAIKAGGMAALVDAENAATFEHAQSMGVDLDYFVMTQPDSGEQGLDQALHFVESGLFDVVIVDSVAALTPKAEIEGEMTDMQVGAQARMMSKGLRKIAAPANASQTTVIFINQLREKIGVMYGNPEDTPGGRALKFYASVRLDVRAPAGDRIYSGTGADKEAIGQKTTVTVRKNKVAPPFKKAQYKLYYGRGIDRASSLLDSLLQEGVWVASAGGVFKDGVSGENVGPRGRDNVEDMLRENPELMDQLQSALEVARAGEAPLAS